MRFKTDWLPHLHRFRTRELEMVFRQYLDKHFEAGLELGAGDGFQSTLLSKYVTRLISTDYDAEILTNHSTEAISYRLCDAEKVDEVFRRGQFDLVFSSSLLEHLPDLDRALAGIHTVLADDGLGIHIMPSPLWKACHLLLHFPNRILLILERLTEPGGIAAAIAKIRGSGERTAPLRRTENNPKVLRQRRPYQSRWLLPDPHGAAPSHWREFRAFSRSRWVKQFQRAGFRITGIRKGPFASGYGFGLDGVRRLLEGLGIASEFIYIVAKK